MKTMKFKNLIAVAATAMLLLGGASAGAATDANGKPMILSGTVKIETTQISFIVSGKAGGGVLTFNGSEHEFSIGGLGIGGMGIQKISAVGAVYNLNDISQFAGSFVQARAGVTLGKGKGVMSLSNGNGVIMELKFTGEGLALSVGVDGLIVSMK
jgi:hypothetical protein